MLIQNLFLFIPFYLTLQKINSETFNTNKTISQQYYLLILNTNYSLLRSYKKISINGIYPKILNKVSESLMKLKKMIS
jgi:hypothetical protein